MIVIAEIDGESVNPSYSRNLRLNGERIIDVDIIEHDVAEVKTEDDSYTIVFDDEFRDIVEHWIIMLSDSDSSSSESD